MISYKTIKIILQTLLLSVICILPFIKIRALYFPFISGKVYSFRFLVCLAFFFWIWLMFKKEKTGFQNRFLSLKNILIIGLLFFFLVQVVVAFLGVSPNVSFFSTIERQDGVIQYGFWILYFLMILSVFKTYKEWKILLLVFIITAFLVSSYAWLNLATQDRLSGIFGNPSYLAAYLLFAIGFCFIFIERKFFEGYFWNVLLLGAAGFFVVALVYTQTRGAYLGLAGGVFLFCLLSVLFLRKQNKKLAIFCAIILAIGIISVAGLFIVKDANFVKESPLLSRITEVTNFWEIGSIRERILTWQIALEAFAEKPIFGYGPENFPVAFNKYYDFRIGRGESWFDRTHNIFLEPLATGGVVLFSGFILFLASISYAIFKIARTEKILAFILGGIFLAYIIQGVFLFDSLPVYLGLFPFLAFVVYVYKENYVEKVQDIKHERKFSLSRWQNPILFVTACVCLIGIYTTVFVPYTASASAIQFLAYTSQGYYKEAIPFAKKAFDINSPYTYWELRKRAGWQFLNIIDGDSKFTDQEAQDLGDVYDIVVPELEKFVQARPFDPQIYFVLPRIYRLSYEKIGKNDLLQAEALLQKSFTYSSDRVEYYNEMAQILLLENKFGEGEKLLRDYADRTSSASFSYFPNWLLGHYYYVAGKYDLAMENYIMAKEKDYKFYENDGEYSRYIDTAQNTKNYQEIVDMSINYLEYAGPSADTYFNIALGYYYLREKENAKEYFTKVLELNQEQYKKYEPFFFN